MLKVAASVILLLLQAALYKAQCGVKKSSCDPNNIFYSLDGSCNNLVESYYGSAGGVYDRLGQPTYGDGIGTPRKSVTGGDLPNERVVRQDVLPHAVDRSDCRFNRNLMGALQFSAHDLSNQDKGTTRDDSCCTFDYTMNGGLNCDSIKIPANDSVYGATGVTCNPYVNLRTDKFYNCSTTPYNNPISTVTSYLDASVIYANSKAQSDNLRTFVGGKLKMRTVNNFDYLPFNPSDIECYIPPYSGDKCYLSGDINVNQNIDLGIQEILWHRLHNIWAGILGQINPCWSDEEIFQNTRRILIASMQWMFYYEILPLIMGPDTTYATGLTVPSLGYVDDYDPTCNANVFNEFACGISRNLHSGITGKLNLADEHFKEIGHAYLPDYMQHIQGFLESGEHFEEALNGGIQQRSFEHGRYQEFTVSNNFFLKYNHHGTDLITVDLRRCRNNGALTYNDLREVCGYPRAKNFDELSDLIDPLIIAKLKLVYDCVDDIDLSVGSRSETRTNPHSMLTPTEECVFVKQYNKTRRCDRLFFEHPQAGFNLAQLNEIRAKSYGAIFYCVTGNDQKLMPPHAFVPVSDVNVPIPCEAYPRINLALWADPRCFLNPF